MHYAILRHSKITSKIQAAEATAHNYRQYEVSNVDQGARHPNVEFVNLQERDYWELASERIEEAGIVPRRKDSVRCAEIILSASPEWFERDADGRAADYSQSAWLKDTKTYLTEKYGEKNVIGFQLQQDEKSPHVHAIVVPITPDGRLSARDLFNPTTLRSNQTEYAKAMKPHGLERGVEYSQAKHQPMKRMYGQQAQTAAELGAQLGPASTYKDVQVKRPEAKDVLKLGEWEARTSAQVNEPARTQVEQANIRAEKAQNIALENAAAKDQVRALQKQLSTLQASKQASTNQSNELAKRLAGGETPPAEWMTRGNRLLDEATRQVRDERGKVASLKAQAEFAEKKGDYALVADLRFVKLPEQEKKTKLLEDDLGSYAGGRIRLADLDAEPARAAAEQARLAARQADLEQANRLAAEQRRVEQVVKHELALMDKAFSIYGSGWKVGPNELAACLIVPKEKVKQVEERLRVEGLSYACHLSVQGEPMRTDGQETVYVKYQANFARQASHYFDQVRAGKGQVYEHASHQARREQLYAQPQAKTLQRVQEPTRTKGFGIGD